MPGVNDVRPSKRRLQSRLAEERFGVCFGYFGAFALKLLDAPQLGKADRSMHVGKVIFEPQVIDFVVPGTGRTIPFPRVAIHPMQAGHSYLVSQPVVLRRRDSTFGTRYVFRGIKAKAGDVANRTNPNHSAPVKL